jgi:hypothetical protein
MSPLELHTQSGIHVLPENFLLVGIDETGHESPSPSNHPKAAGPPTAERTWLDCYR